MFNGNAQHGAATKRIEQQRNKATKKNARQNEQDEQDFFTRKTPLLHAGRAKGAVKTTADFADSNVKAPAFAQGLRRGKTARQGMPVACSSCGGTLCQFPRTP